MSIIIAHKKLEQGECMEQALHAWNLEPHEAIVLQGELAKRIVREDQLDPVHLVAGVDMAINENNGMARAAVVLLTYPELEVIERHIYEEPIRMP